MSLLCARQGFAECAFAGSSHLHWSQEHGSSECQERPYARFHQGEPRSCSRSRPASWRNVVVLVAVVQLEDTVVSAPVVGDFNNDGWNDVILVTDGG